MFIEDEFKSWLFQNEIQDMCRSDFYNQFYNIYRSKEEWRKKEILKLKKEIKDGLQNQKWAHSFVKFEVIKDLEESLDNKIDILTFKFFGKRFLDYKIDWKNIEIEDVEYIEFYFKNEDIKEFEEKDDILKYMMKNWRSDND